MNPNYTFRHFFTFYLLLSICLFSSSCITANPVETEEDQNSDLLLVGAERLNQFLPILKGKTVGLVVNHSSILNYKQKPSHLVDTLLHSGINIGAIFAPEHGFRGTADAGESVESGMDIKTGLPLISLYGSHKKPTPEDLEGIDIMIFDIQDVGTRFYTYISTMHYVMEACAENKIQLLVLDRPNPNGFYIDGPVLEMELQSFVGMHKIPVVHGLTVGELAYMINGEGWLKGSLSCELIVIPISGYTHSTLYELPISPSPNLPNMTSIYLYPSLCLFEGTVVSIGRGTDKPFQQYGHPDFSLFSYAFNPKTGAGSKHPKHEGKTCYGELLTSKSDQIITEAKMNLSWIIKAYKSYDEEDFFNGFFKKLAGTEKLQKQLESGLTETEIRQSWNVDLNIYKQLRKKYLLYPDFNNN